jgi:dTDP-4-amino-4,6-dideoxygalactose transaminase
MENNSVSLPSSNVWKIPRSNAHLFNQQIREEILQAVQPALFGDYWDFPKLLIQFEKQFAEFIGLAHVAAVQSGSSALLLALRAAGLKAGDEVITVANSDMSTTSSIRHCGARPVFCDILDSDYTINPDLVETLITERTTGLLPVDLYGHPANMKALQQIAKKHGLFIVEDAAIATAARDFGKGMGAFADLVCFSTCSTKQIGAIGNGGMVATDDPDLRERLEVFRGYGLNPETSKTQHAGNDQIADGYNLKMSPVDAAVLSVKMSYLPAWTERRKQIARHYESRLHGVAGITLPTFRPESEPVRREFALCVKQRDQVFIQLRENGVQTALNYCPPAHQRKVYQELNLPGSTNLKQTEQISREIITLPIDPLLTNEDIDYVCDQLILAVKTS